MDAGIACLQGGDRLEIKAGKYRPPLGIVASGTAWDRATVITHFANDTVIWGSQTESSCFLYPCQGYPGQRYVVIDGIINDGSVDVSGEPRGTPRYTSPEPAGVDHIRYINYEHRYHRGNFTPSGNYNEYITSKFHHNGERSWDGSVFCYSVGCGTPQDHGLYVNGHDVLVDGCEFYENWGCGLHMYSAQNKNSNSIIRNNYAHDNGKGKGCAGLLVAGASNVQVYNNIGINQYGGSGISIYRNVDHALVYNNTAYGNDVGGIDFGGTSGHVVRNNLAFHNHWDMLSTGGYLADVQYNFCNTAYQMPGCTVKGDPGFVSSSPSSVGDFALRADSVARNQGVDLGLVYQLDMAGALRGSDGAWDLGALEYGGTFSAPANISLSPSPFDFGQQIVGTTSSIQFVTVTNIGGSLWTFSPNMALTGDFSFGGTGNCESSLPPGASCTVSLKFTPSSVGIRSGSLTVFGGNLSLQKSIQLLGEGVVAPLPEMDTTPPQVEIISPADGSTIAR